MSSAEDNASLNDKIAALEKELAKKEKINQVLMKRIEHEYDSQGDAFSLFQAASSLEIEVKERTAALEKAMQELTNTNAKLEKTLQELEESQTRLVLSEKMAALGQLISGIAHEINTPLGVIGSSIGTMSGSLEAIGHQQLANIRSFSNEAFDLFSQLIDSADLSGGDLPAREQRKIRRAIFKKLEEYEVPEADEIADKLLDAGVHHEIAELYTALKAENGVAILDSALEYAHLKQGQKHIDLAVKKASKVIFALKKFAHHDDSGDMILTDINDNIDTVLTLYSNTLQQGVSVEKQLSNLPSTFCYPEEISQIWTNLIFNAIQAMDNKGELTISTIYEDPNIIVQIQDNGPGIPEEIQSKIFDSFFTTKPAGEGTGLGLNIIRNIIKKHHGSIGVKSVPGNTCFTITLPLISELV